MNLLGTFSSNADLWGMVWDKIARMFQFDRGKCEDWYDSSWLLDEQCNGPSDKEVFLAWVANTLWQLWVNRNESHFHNCLLSVNTLFRRVIAATNDCLRVFYKPEGTAWSSLDQTPTVVDDYRYNIECDDSFNEELCNAATGYLTEDVGGRMVAAGCAACSAGNPVLAEGLAILSGLSRMKTESWERARICTDSKQRADIVNNKALAPWFLKSLYRDILSLVSETKVLNCLHIKR